MRYQWEWTVIWNHLDVFFYGARMTLFLTFATMAIGLVVGLFLGLGHMARNALFRIPSQVFVEVFRDTPLLVQLFWIFYCLPILIGIELGVMTAAILGLSMQASAYLAEVYRAGIQSVDRGQMESARSLGMSFSQAMQRIVLPQAIRRMVPPFLNVTADYVKASSLASVVGVYELFRETNNLIQNTWRPLEAYTAVAVAYFLLIYPIVWFTARLERHLARRITAH